MCPGSDDEPDEPRLLRLAAGLAHDVNNVLTIVTASAKYLKEGLAPDDPMRAVAEDILEAALRGATITHQLLTLARRELVEPSVVEVDAVVESLIELLRRTVGPGVEVSLHTSAAGSRVRGFGGQLEHAIVNLVINARDAMPAGGRLQVETHDAEGFVVIRVSDTGQGMDEATKARAFEPFFTTKEPSRGTGLGLALVQEFVTRSGGHIELSSEVGRGTIFELHLPRVAADLDDD